MSVLLPIGMFFFFKSIFIFFQKFPLQSFQAEFYVRATFFLHDASPRPHLVIYRLPLCYTAPLFVADKPGGDFRIGSEYKEKAINVCKVQEIKP